jgi:hypothetical protein
MSDKKGKGLGLNITVTNVTIVSKSWRDSMNTEIDIISLNQ